jgi:Cu/Ag efflux pump CusA
VSLTVTPVLGYLLLGRARLLERRGDAWLLAVLKSLVRPILRLTLRWSGLVLFVVAILCALSILSIGWMGGEFLPPFNEGTLTVNLQAEPGTSLEESQRIAKQAEQLLLEVPEVVAVSRRTGRAELDEHAEGVNSSEIEVRLLPERQPLPGVLPAFLRAVPLAHFWGYEQTGRARALVWDEIRDRVTRIPGVKVNIGQPISHRLDHVMSGVRAQIAVKIFGSDLTELRARAQDVATVMAEVRGVVDLLIEPQIEIPQLRLRVKPVEAARYGLAAGDIARLLETAYRGRVVSQILEEDRYFDLVVWFEESARSDPGIINQTILETPSGRRVALGTVAEVLDTTGPNTINRENVQRRMVVSCNVAGRDLAGVVGEIRERVQPIATELVQLPGSYRLELGGQFEAQQAANVRLAVLGLLAVIVIFLLLTRALRSSIAALQVLANIPLAALGSVIALLIVNQPDWEILNAAPVWDWPRLWFGSITLSVAHWVGFITLIGIVSRNGIMMLSHYLHLMEHEGEVFGEEMIIRGSLERLAPVMMTALTSFVGLLPLLLGAGEPGKEILHPLAVVVFGGMLASTILDQVVTPALFYRVGRRINWNSMVSGKSQPENVV